MKIADELVRRRSYEIWKREGCPYGYDLAHWLRAKRELEAEYQSTDPRSANGEYAGFVVPRPTISRPPRKLVSQRIGKYVPKLPESLAAAMGSGTSRK